MRLAVTAHAVEQWVRRIRELDIDGPATDTIRRAWHRGVPIDRTGNLRGDEIRADPEYGAILIRRGPRIVTVMTPETTDGVARTAAENALAGGV